MTTKVSPPLTSLSEAQRTQALERFALLRPALEGQISQTQLARDQQIPLSTIQRWIKQYREKGLAGLANARRSDKDTSRHLSAEAITLIEGLALQTPARSMTAIHRQVVEIAKAQGWKPPSYDNVRQVIRERQRIAKSLICSIGERPRTPMRCGKRITVSFLSFCSMKQASRTIPTLRLSKMTTAA
jgi:transposase-like protein